MDGTCTIRTATPADAAGFARVQIEAWQAAYRGILPQDYLDRMDQARLTVGWKGRLAAVGSDVRQLTLCAGDDVVGWSGFGMPRDEVEDGIGEVHAINVSPTFWSRGFGSALFSRSVSDLAAMGYRCGYLWVADGNDRAMSFYERHGWTADGGTKDDDRFTPALRQLRVVSSAFD